LGMLRSTVATYESWRKKCAEIDPRLEMVFVRGTFVSVAFIVFLAGMLTLSAFDSGQDNATTEARQEETIQSPETDTQLAMAEVTEGDSPDDSDSVDQKPPDLLPVDRGGAVPAELPEPSRDAEPVEPGIESDSDKLQGYLFHVECRTHDTRISCCLKTKLAEVFHATVRPAGRTWSTVYTASRETGSSMTTYSTISRGWK
jgi:hypothetical protein